MATALSAALTLAVALAYKAVVTTTAPAPALGIPAAQISTQASRALSSTGKAWLSGAIVVAWLWFVLAAPIVFRLRPVFPKMSRAPDDVRQATSNAAANDPYDSNVRPWACGLLGALIGLWLAS